MLMPWGEFDRANDIMEDFRRRVEQLFGEFESSWMHDWGAGLRTASWPRAELRDTGAALTLSAELPGMSERDVHLTVNGQVVTLEGERRDEVPEGYSVHRRERAQVRFARSFTLPCKIDPERVEASLENGVLTVTLPKAPEARPRQIAVRTSERDAREGR